MSITHKFQIQEQKGYIIVGLFDDGRPGEVFLKIGKEGSTARGLLDCVGILTSVALQHGVPLETIADKLSHVRFDPCGCTTNPQIPIAKSFVDYIFRWMALTFIDSQTQGQAMSADDPVDTTTPENGDE